MADERTDCCVVDVDPRIARHFDAGYATLADSELPEMVDVSRGLVELLPDVAELRPTLLELGCGTAGLTVELLRRGAVRADGVDLSPGSLAVARRRAEAGDVADRVDFTLGDAAQVALQPHDWVVLDRVICCYRHVDALMGNAIGAARWRLIFSVPHDRGWRGAVNKLIVTAENLINRFRGRPCPGYNHNIGRIERRIAAAGFSRRTAATFGLWYAAVWERTQPADG